MSVRVKSRSVTWQKGWKLMTFKLSNGKFLANTEVVIFEKQIVTTRQRVQNKNPLIISVCRFSTWKH